MNISAVRATDHLAGNRFQPAGEPPFGLFGDDEIDAVEGFFERVFDRVADGAVDVGEPLLDRLERWFGDLF